MCACVHVCPRKGQDFKDSKNLKKLKSVAGCTAGACSTQMTSRTLINLR
jgi:hypothetical protein